MLRGDIGARKPFAILNVEPAQTCFTRARLHFHPQLARSPGAFPDARGFA
jgi:hypothetical protein